MEEEEWDFADLEDLFTETTPWRELSITERTPLVNQGPYTRSRGLHNDSPPLAEVVDLTSSPQTMPPSRKRKRSDDPATSRSRPQPQPVEQEAPPPQGTKIGKMSCIICMEPYTNATVASCGHIYCHECLTRALMASERNATGSCPSCRKSISRKKANQIIPVNFMKKTAYKPRDGK